MPKFSGRCACGNVTYETDAGSLVMMNCHCRDCQRASGSAFAPVIAFPAGQLRLSGELKYFPTITDRGTTLERGFCPTCGNPIAIKAARPDIIFVQAASLDDPALYRPSANIWMRGAVPWDHLDPALSRFEKMRR